MKRNDVLNSSLSYLCIMLILMIPCKVSACSTFKLQKGDNLICGHNLNQGDLDVPGLIFINKRGIFKTGRTWSEIATKEKMNPSFHCWISRYGSVTFNNLGRDFPDGGMNEAGLYVWEMNVDFDDYPKNDSLPKLNQMNWMQYILDNYSTTEEAIQCASEIEIDGWSWHFFVGDARGNAAAIDFSGDKVVVHKGESMPVPGLFNTPYDRELELLKYYKGFGGLYEPDLNNPEVPRFVKTAVMIRDYKPTQDVIDDGFEMLKNLMVYDVPEWSIIFDVQKRNVYFKTRINPEMKRFSMDELDFSNECPVLILNMDIKNGGNVLDQFHPYSNNEMREFTESFILPILPEEFYTQGGITKDEYLDRISTHSDAATLDEKQFFKGVWKNKPDKIKDEKEVTIKLETNGDAVFGHISISGDTEKSYKAEHIQLIGNNLKCTYRTEDKRFIEVQASIDDEKMNVTLCGNRYTYGNYLLYKQ